MSARYLTCIIIALVVLVNPISIFANPIIIIEPNSIEDDLNAGENGEYVLNVTNEGDEELIFSIEHEIIEQERDSRPRSVSSIEKKHKNGPQRDDFGDIIDEYQLDQAQWTGLAWDGNLMWGIEADEGNVIAFDPQIEQIVAETIVRGQHSGLACDGETFWSGVNNRDDGEVLLVQFDREGNELNTYAMPGEIITGVAFDGENVWFYSAEMNRMGIIRQVSVEGEMIREVDCNELFGGDMNFLVSLLWVPTHEDGPLWAYDGINSIFYQLNVEGEEPELIQQIEINQMQYVGFDHDGDNFWLSSINGFWYVVDDGISEAGRWLSYNPESAVLNPESDLDIIVTLDAAGVVEGDYEAIMHFLSDDPDNPVVEIPVAMHISGIPELEVVWSEDIGWPDIIDWNREFEDLFSGGPYSISIVAQNMGTAIINIEDITVANDLFTVEPVQLSIEPGEESEIQVTLNANENGVHETDLTIVWNSPEGDNFVTSLTGETSSPPVFRIDPDAIEDELLTGERRNHLVAVSNEGDADLRFNVGFELISEPEDDIIQRNIRDTKGCNYPTRDRIIPGFLGEYFEGVNFDELVTSRQDDHINFRWELDGPMGNMPNDNFSVRWTGKIQVEENGDYLFSVTSDDGSRLFLDESLIVDSWNNEGPRTEIIEVTLNHGIHDVTFEMCERNAFATAILFWQPPDAEELEPLPGFTGFDWISVEPREGRVPSNESLDIEISIDTNGLTGGEYEADMILFSNDPATPEISVNVLLTVTDAPDIGVYWAEEAGWDENINWNLVHPEIFSGQVYEVPVEIENYGSADLEIDEVSSSSEYFTVDFDSIILEPGEAASVNITFQTAEDETGLFEGVLSIFSDDPDEEVIEIPMRAHSFFPPVFSINQDMIEEDIRIGDSVERVINIFNDGGYPLKCEISDVIISEPERDLIVRSIRGTGNDQRITPYRDELGDEICRYEVEGAITGFAWDGEFMWCMNSDGQQLIAFDRENEQVADIIQIPDPGLGLAYDGEFFWYGTFNEQEQGAIVQMDREANILNQFETGDLRVFGVGLDEEGIWYYCSQLVPPQVFLRHISYDDDMLQEIDCGEIMQNGNGCLSVVPDHEDGPLWFLNWTTRMLSQIRVEGDDLVFIQEVQFVRSNFYGIGHDGENLWVSTDAGIWYVIDDGVRENNWMSYEPKEVEIEADDEEDVFVTLDASECPLGEYEAELHIMSNDPVNQEMVINISMTVFDPDGVSSVSEIPNTHYLNECYPNPFNSNTRIVYGLSRSEHVRIQIYDITGKVVAILQDGVKSSGHHTLIWKAPIAAGIYLVRLETSGFVATQRVILMK